MKDPFKRILDLVRKTGDTVIVTDPNGEDVYVVMGLDQYEAMVACEDHEDESWQEEDEESEWQIPDEFVIDDPEGGLADEPVSTPPSSELNIWNTMQSANQTGPTWDPAKMNEEQTADLKRHYREFAAQSSLSSPTASDQTQVPPKTNEDPFSEEQFYLEPVE